MTLMTDRLRRLFYGWVERVLDEPRDVVARRAVAR